MQSFRHLLAMENELFFIYDYKTHNFKINNFIDNEIHNIIDMDISELTSKMEDEHLISDDTIDEYNAFVADMKKGTVSYTHRFKTNMLTKKAEYDLIELKVTTITVKISRPKLLPVYAILLIHRATRALQLTILKKQEVILRRLILSSSAIIIYNIIRHVNSRLCF